MLYIFENSVSSRFVLHLIVLVAWTPFEHLCYLFLTFVQQLHTHLSRCGHHSFFFLLHTIRFITRIVGVRIAMVWRVSIIFVVRVVKRTRVVRTARLTIQSAPLLVAQLRLVVLVIMVIFQLMISRLVLRPLTFFFGRIQ
jgi:hypothetical protein